MSTLTGSDAHASEQRQRTLYVGLWVVGAVALGVLAGVGYPLAGVGLYVVAVLGALAVWARYPRPLFDERDTAIHRAASARTLTLVGLASAVVFPALTALYGLGYFEWAPWTTAVALTVAALYVLYGLASAREGRRR